MDIYEFGTAPQAKSAGYKLVSTLHSTEAFLRSMHQGEDLIFVYGPSVHGQPGVFEFARFEREMETFGHENKKHPYHEYCLADAVQLANAEQSIGLKPKVTSLVQAREVVKAMFQTVRHNWITGCCALDVLDAAIDGRDLKTDNRIIVISQENQQEQTSV